MGLLWHLAKFSEELSKKWYLNDVHRYVYSISGQRIKYSRLRSESAFLYVESALVSILCIRPNCCQFSSVRRWSNWKAYYSPVLRLSTVRKEISINDIIVFYSIPINNLLKIPGLTITTILLFAINLCILHKNDFALH